MDAHPGGERLLKGTGRLAVTLAAAVAALFALAGSAAADFADHAAPAPAQDFASQELDDELADELVDDDEAVNYGFVPPVTSVTVGDLRVAYRPADALREGTLPLTLRERLKFVGEWVAPVTQAGAVRNAVGVYAEGTTWSMSTFGYGARLGEALTTLSPTKAVMYEPEIDSWYVVDELTVTPISGSYDAAVLGIPLTWETYQTDLLERTLSSMPDSGTTAAVGGSGAGAAVSRGAGTGAGAAASDDTTSSGSIPPVPWLAVGLLAVLGMTTLNFRRRPSR